MCNLFYSSLHHVLSKGWGGGLTFISSLHQIDSSTINGNVELYTLSTLYSDVTSVN